MWNSNYNDRCILHCDLNNFFASVELLEHPELKGCPVCVGGDEKARHGIVLAKNERAKKYGVKTGEPLAKAFEKCPMLKVLASHYDKYVYYSKLVKAIYMRYTDQVEAFGADECWLDVTGSRFLFGDGVTIANSIREAVKKETGLTISVGVSYNKIFAKLGSDMKKPDAVTEISREGYKEKVCPLPCGELFGVGRSTAEKLRRHGIYTIGELASTDEEFIRRLFGKNGVTLLKYAKGYDDMPVAYESYKPICKSISHGCTSAFDLKDEREAELLIMQLSDMVGEKLREENFAAHKIQITVRDNKLADVSFSESYSYPIIRAKQIKNAATRLFLQKYSFENPVRAISVGVSELECDDVPYQLDLYTDHDMLERDVAKERAAEEIRRRLGKKAIVRGSLLGTTFARSNAIYEFNPFQNNFVR